MSTVVYIPGSLRALTGGQAKVLAEGCTVADVIDDLEVKYRGMRGCLLDGRGVRRFVNLYIGEEDIRFLAGLETELKAGDSLTILPTLSGG
jgi:molybdopterin synthase sulfur carrier subunit